MQINSSAELNSAVFPLPEHAILFQTVYLVLRSPLTFSDVSNCAQGEQNWPAQGSVSTLADLDTLHSDGSSHHDAKEKQKRKEGEEKKKKKKKKSPGSVGQTVQKVRGSALQGSHMPAVTVTQVTVETGGRAVGTETGSGTRETQPLKLTPIPHLDHKSPVVKKYPNTSDRNTHTHIYTHIYIYSHTHTLTHSHTHTLTHSHTHILTHSHTHTLTYSHTPHTPHSHTHTLTHSHTHTLTHSHKRTHTYTHTQAHAHIHTHTLTHTQTHTDTHRDTHTQTHKNVQRR